MPRLVGYGFPNAPASAVIHSRTDLIIFGDPLWLISFFQICFWCVGFDTLLNLVALNMYGSSRRAIVSMILTPTSIRIHPKAMHPYPLYIHSIAFLACCSNLAEESFIQSASHARAMGNCSTCCIGRGKEVGMADDGRCVSFVVLKRVDNDLWQRSQIQAFLLSAASNDLSKMP